MSRCEGLAWWQDGAATRAGLWGLGEGLLCAGHPQGRSSAAAIQPSSFLNCVRPALALTRQRSASGGILGRVALACPGWMETAEAIGSEVSDVAQSLAFMIWWHYREGTKGQGWGVGGSMSQERSFGICFLPGFSPLHHGCCAKGSAPPWYPGHD